VTTSIVDCSPSWFSSAPPNGKQTLLIIPLNRELSSNFNSFLQAYGSRRRFSLWPQLGRPKCFPGSVEKVIRCSKP